MSKLLAFFTELYEVNPLLIAMQVVLFVLVIIAVLMVSKYMIKHNVVKRQIAKLTSDLATQERLREDEYKQVFEMEGEFIEKSRMRRLTRALEQSGIKKTYPEMSAELFVVLVSGLCLIAGLGVGLIFNSSLYGLIAATVVLVTIYLYVTIMISKNQKALERDALKFVNLLENMSHTEQSIAEMLGKCIPYLNDPLKSSIEKCYYDIKTTGDIEGALTRLADRTDYKQLRDVFNYLRVCSSHNENYAEIIQDNREIIRMHLAFEKEKRSIKKSALTDMGIIGFAGILIVYITAQMVDNVQDLLFHNIIGEVILVGIGASLLYGIYTIIKQDKQ